jgi:hypothetical protein
VLNCHDIQGLVGSGCTATAPRNPRESPVVDGVALRLRLPAKQALYGDAMPIGMRMFPSPRLVRSWSAAQLQKRQNPSKLAEITLLSF